MSFRYKSRVGTFSFPQLSANMNANVISLAFWPVEDNGKRKKKGSDFYIS